MKSEYKSFIYLGLAIVIVVGGIIFYNSQVKAPQAKVEEQSSIIKELQANQSRLEEMLRQNKTMQPGTEFGGDVGGVGFWAVFFFLLFAGTVLYILYTRFVKPIKEERNLEQIKEFYQGKKDANFNDGYMERVLGFKVFELVKFFKGKYKGDHKFTLHLSVFTIKQWGNNINRQIMYNTEPPKEFLVGIFGSAGDLNEVKEIFKGISVTDMIKNIHKTHQGIRMFPHEPVVTPSYEIDYKKSMATQQDIAAAPVSYTHLTLPTILLV